MEKRVILAATLSLLIILGWSTIVSKFYPIEPQTVIKKEVLKISPNSQEPKSLPEEKLLSNQREFSFVIPWAAIKEVLFKDYQNWRFSLSEGFLWRDDPIVVFKKERLGQDSYFTYADQEKRISKEFIFHNSNYTIDLNIKIQNLSLLPININPSLILAKVDLKGMDLNTRFREVVLSYKDKILRLSPTKTFNSPEDINFIAFRDRYFCAIIEPSLTGFKGFLKRLNSKDAELGLSYQAQINPGEEKNLNFLIYLGPQELQKIPALKTEWQKVIYYGAFDSISKLLLRLLHFFQSIVHNWGIALILLSLFIYLIFYPLTLKQMRSMKKMQDLQPKVEEVRQLYKNNPQRLNKEIMELYRQEKINPFGGCLPLIVQIPIFFALYQALMRSLELKGAPFLWIKDLSEPDRLIILRQPLPFLGKEINLIPLLMMIIMFFQQKISQPPTAGTGTEQQRLMSILFPLMFGIIFYHMPAGLVLYWFINSLFMFLYQFRIRTRH